jgi:uncharacterized membrane protein (UPF0127 family)
MHRRFEGVATATLGCPGGTIHVLLAESIRLRFLGLMRLDGDEVKPLLFLRCRSIHTFGMKSQIDLVWLALNGEHGRVLQVVEGLGPRGHARGPRAGVERRTIAALELAAGEAERLGLSAGAIVGMR